MKTSQSARYSGSVAAKDLQGSPRGRNWPVFTLSDFATGVAIGEREHLAESSRGFEGIPDVPGFQTECRLRSPENLDDPEVATVARNWHVVNLF